MYVNKVNIEELVGKCITSISDSRIECTDGTIFTIDHIQDCCEQTTVSPIRGDVREMFHSPVTHARKVVDNAPEGGTRTTFYIRTDTGSVDIEWIVESNGYYDESVDVWKTDPINEHNSD